LGLSILFPGEDEKCILEFVNLDGQGSLRNKALQAQYKAFHQASDIDVAMTLRVLDSGYGPCLAESTLTTPQCRLDVH
jgi:hypothetical protein